MNELERKAKALSEQVKRIGAPKSKPKVISSKPRSLDFVNNLTGITKKRTPEFVNKFVPTKVPEPDSAEMIARKLNTLEGVIDASVIRNLPTIDGVSKDVSKLKQRIDMNDMRWHGSSSGGGVATLNGLTGAVTLSAGSNITLTPTGQNISIAASGGGSPGGSDTQVQFNDSGSFGGNSNLTYNKSTAKLGVVNVVDISGGGMTVEPTGDLILKSTANGVAIQALGTNKDLNLQAYRDINLQSVHRDIVIQSSNDTVIESNGSAGDVTLQSTNGGVTVSAQGSGFDLVLQGNDAVILQVNSANQLILTGGGVAPAVIDTSSITSLRTLSLPNQSGVFATVTSGSGAPGSTPAAIGQIYVDTSGIKVYVSTGTTNSGNWTIIN